MQMGVRTARGDNPSKLAIGSTPAIQPIPLRWESAPLEPPIQLTLSDLAIPPIPQ